jgi:hypothetical protein
MRGETETGKERRLVGKWAAISFTRSGEAYCACCVVSGFDASPMAYLSSQPETETHPTWVEPRAEHGRSLRSASDLASPTHPTSTPLLGHSTSPPHTSLPTIMSDTATSRNCGRMPSAQEPTHPTTSPFLRLLWLQSKQQEGRRTTILHPHGSGIVDGTETANTTRSLGITAAALRLGPAY